MTEPRQGCCGPEGRPEERLTRRDHAPMVLGLLWLPTVLAVGLVRVWNGLRGGPLLIAGLPDPDVAVRWSANRSYFVAGLVLHAAILLFVRAGLAYVFALTRRWRLQVAGR